MFPKIHKLLKLQVKKIHEIKAPEIKYFKPASVEKAEFRLKLAKI